MSDFQDLISSWCLQEQERIIAALCDYIGINTISPNEYAALPFLTRYLEPLGFQFERRAIPEAFWTHPERCPAPLSKFGDRQYILRATRPGTIGKKRLAINCHLDVVPLTSGFEEGFKARWKGDSIIGRGACDTKGNLMMFAEAIRFLDTQAIAIPDDLILDLVVEEEIGGNGGLASVLSGLDANAVLALEPTGFEVFRGHRGCITFEINLFGQSTHMGAAETGLNAIDLAFMVIQRLRAMEGELIQAARQHEAFARWSRPIQINVGQIKGGEWHGSVPEHCQLLGNLGFLPHYGLEGAKKMLDGLLAETVGAQEGARYELTFPGLHNEGCLTAADDPFIHTFIEAARCAGLEIGRVDAWHVSCDCRHYSRTLGLPTLIFGCGQLERAHSNNEQLMLADLYRGIGIICEFLKRGL
ncbi:M20 family metallopeptidase [Synechococcus sp. PCC 7336]|uniref:M20 family metallopeptidase n=1 Tax=Synechococcus sp. PCC 7336 TaxID=195250 RepID=UPI00034BDC74|nr:M20/M25/M40 family metallo-hydrolase [Synechococcus sp. PCC 7336]